MADQSSGRPGPPADPGPLPRLHPMGLAAAAGALWGGLGYAILWGHTPILAGRRFVLSLPGTLALLPVRVVLWSIRTVEGWMGRPFHLAETNWWIGLAAALVGALLAVAALLLVRSAIRRARS